jgi:hypothetical protein
VQIIQGGGHNLCFVVAIIIWVIVGIVLCQIRTLKRYGWIASSAIWMNLLVIFLSMGFIAHSPPNYAAAKAAYGIEQGPIIRQTFASYPFFERINGVMNIVYAYVYPFNMTSCSALCLSHAWHRYVTILILF